MRVGGGAIVGVLVAAALAQAPVTSGAERVVFTAAEIFAREYFDASTAERVAGALTDRFDEGRYRSTTGDAALAEQLTRDLVELTRDKHVAVTVRRDGGASGGGSERRDVPTSAGFRRTEILRGNIGLLEMAFFLRPSEHRDALAAAMRTLQPADALILDIRANGGGSPATVALLLSYMFDTPSLPLFDIRHRTGTPDLYATEATPPAERNATRPVYVLTSSRSFSGGEGLAFILQDMKRAIVIGERTAGAANAGRPYPIDDTFEITVPNGQLLTAKSRRNWEGTGVTPDVRVSADDALRTAHLRALDDLIESLPAGAKRQELVGVRASLRAQ